MAAQLRWTGHFWRMGDERIPKQFLYGELRDGERHQGGHRKRFKDSLKHNMKQCGIDEVNWETMAEDSSRWRTAVKQGVNRFEADRIAALSDRRANRKNRQKLQQAGAGGSDTCYVCNICQRDCHSRIVLVSHSRMHRTWITNRVILDNEGQRRRILFSSLEINIYWL